MHSVTEAGDQARRMPLFKDRSTKSDVIRAQMGSRLGVLGST